MARPKIVFNGYPELLKFITNNQKWCMIKSIHEYLRGCWGISSWHIRTRIIKDLVKTNHIYVTNNLVHLVEDKNNY